MPNTIGPKFPIVVTSYEVAMKDARKHLRHYHWKYMVVDEVYRLLWFADITFFPVILSLLHFHHVR